MVHSRVIVRRKSRIMFGAVLIAGAITLVASTMGKRGDATLIVVVTWAAAFAAAWATRMFAAEGPDRDGLGVAGLVVPSAGIALIGPITLHMPFALMGGAKAFDEWVALSLWITGPTHIAFAIACMIRAMQLARGKRAWSSSRIYLITVVVSCVPFVIFVIPPVLVALTGLPFLLVLGAMETIAERERNELSHTTHELPFAIARNA